MQKFQLIVLLRKVVACVDAPTVIPIRIVTISIKVPFAVSANLFVTPLSLRIFPKNNIPNKGSALGVSKDVNINPTIGKSTFSSF